MSLRAEVVVCFSRADRQHLALCAHLHVPLSQRIISLLASTTAHRTLLFLWPYRNSTAVSCDLGKLLGSSSTPGLTFPWAHVHFLALEHSFQWGEGQGKVGEGPEVVHLLLELIPVHAHGGSGLLLQLAAFHACAHIRSTGSCQPLFERSHPSHQQAKTGGVKRCDLPVAVEHETLRVVALEEHKAGIWL